MNYLLASLKDIDYCIFSFVNQFALRNPFFDFFAKFFAEKFQFIVVVFLGLLLIKNFEKYFRMVIAAIFAAVFSRFFIVEIIRYLIPRARPFVNNQINLLIDYNPSESSFPSGHASFFFALAMVIYLYNKTLGALLFASAFLISVARIFIGVHWPMDIFVGAVVGAVIGWLIFKISQKPLKQKAPN